MGLGIREMYRGLDDGAPFAGAFGAAFHQDFSVKIEMIALGVLAGVAVVDAYAELVVAGSGWCEGASPTDGVVVPLKAGDGNDLVPVEVDVAVSAREHRLTAQVP